MSLTPQASPIHARSTIEVAFGVTLAAAGLAELVVGVLACRAALVRALGDRALLRSLTADRASAWRNELPLWAAVLVLAGLVMLPAGLAVAYVAAL